MRKTKGNFKNISVNVILWGDDMKLKDAQVVYRDYRSRLIDETKKLVKKRDEATKKFEATGDSSWSDEAATLQLSIDETKKKFEDNQEVLDGLVEQWVNAANAENARALADPETGMAATISKIMTTVARICAGDKVPASDEKKLMDYNSELYGKAKQAQMMMAAMKEKQKEYDSVWSDEEDENKYDPEGVADNTEAQGELPEVPAESTDGGMETASEE